MNSVAAIVVSHNNYPDVLKTVQDLQEQTLPPSSILIVDNSTDRTARTPTDNAPSTCTVLHVTNKGYANAVNIGLMHLQQQPEWNEKGAVLVCTHEVRLERDCIQLLKRTLDSDASIGAAGPLLTDQSKSDAIVWSGGGGLRKASMTPRHLLAGLHRTQAQGVPPVIACDWLDGALVLYQAEALEEHPLSEDFFLYFEETDCHTRMRRAGWTIACVRPAVASQKTSGIDPRLHGANLVLFLRRNGSVATVTLGVVRTLVVIVLQCVMRKVDWRYAKQFVAGLSFGHTVGTGKKRTVGEQVVRP